MLRYSEDNMQQNETDKRLDRMEGKIDKIVDGLAAHAVLHGRNTESLEHHIARTDKLEVIVQQNRSNIESTLIPLKQTDTILRACLKAVFIVAAVVSIVYTATRLFKGI